MENKFYDGRESSLTKYYCIRSKLTVFKKFLTFPFKLISMIVYWWKFNHTVSYQLDYLTGFL